ncbi:MAG: biopolymer transporter ExbD, partial [Bacteroidota bacterium]
TSSVVVPNALNLKMPGNSSKVVTVDSKPSSVRIEGRGTFKVDGRMVSKSKLESKLRSLARQSRGKKLDMTLTPTRNTTNESMVFVMDIMQRLNINCILAIEE